MLSGTEAGNSARCEQCNDAIQEHVINRRRERICLPCFTAEERYRVRDELNSAWNYAVLLGCSFATSGLFMVADEAFDRALRRGTLEEWRRALHITRNFITAAEIAYAEEDKRKERARKRWST